MKEMIYGNNGRKSEILVNGTYKGIQYVVLNIRGTHPCCYVNLPEDHPWTRYVGDNSYANFNCGYDEIPVECHGGLTFADDHLNCKTHYEGDKRVVDVSLPGNWIGWDYAHCEDFTWYPGREPYKFEKVWTIAELIADCKKVIDQVIEVYEK